MDWKPLDLVSGVCLECGLSYHTQVEITSLDQVNAERKNEELGPISALRKPTKVWLDGGWETAFCLENKVDPPNTKDITTNQLADWIDPNVIAENIIEELQDYEVEPTLDNAKAVWLDFLENELHEGLRQSIEAQF